MERSKGPSPGYSGQRQEGIAGVGAALVVLRQNFDPLFRAAFTLAATLALEVFLLPLLAAWGAWRSPGRSLKQSGGEATDLKKAQHKKQS